MVSEKPTDAPKEGYEYALKTNPKAKGYAEALIDTGMDQVLANEKAEVKYPSKWIQRKIGTSDRKASIQMAINGLVKYSKGLIIALKDDTGGVEDSFVLARIKGPVKALGSATISGWKRLPNPLKDGGVQYWQGEPVMRWLPDPSEPFDEVVLSARILEEARRKDDDE